jgi:CO dehydrogenase maturation factor
MVADPTPVGIVTVSRLIELVKELNLNIPKLGLVLNRTNGDLNPRIKEAIEKLNVTIFGFIPMDSAIEELNMAERSLLELPENSPAVVAAAKLVEAVRN